MTNLVKMHEHEFHTILVTGVPGVGKSSIVNRIQEKYDVECLNFGDVLFDLVQEKKLEGIEHVDQMRQKLDINTCHQLQLEVAGRLNEKRNGHLVVTSHLSISTPNGFMPGFPESIIDVLGPCLIVLVEAPAEEIRARRQADKSDRVRGGDLETNIDFQQQLNRSLAASYAYKTSQFTLPIANKQGKLKDAFAQLEKTLDQYFK